MGDEMVDGAFLLYMDGLFFADAQICVESCSGCNLARRTMRLLVSRPVRLLLEDTSVLRNHSSDRRMLESNNDPTCYSIRRDVSVI